MVSSRVVRPIRESDQRAFGQWITNYDWAEVKSAETVQCKTSTFYETLQGAIDKFFPTKITSNHVADKPWITANLKSLILKRQKAFASGKMCLWGFLRNKSSRLIKNAKQIFYDTSVGKLKKLNPRQWHQQIRKLTGYGKKKSFDLPGSSAKDIANTINMKFISVAQDIPPLDHNSQVLCLTSRKAHLCYLIFILGTQSLLKVAV